MSLSPNLFLRVKPCALVALLKNSPQPLHVSALARASGMTYVYATRFLRVLEQDGLVSFEVKGRVKLVRLTERGASFAGVVDAALKAFGEKTEAKEEAKKAEPAPPPGEAKEAKKE